MTNYDLEEANLLRWQFGLSLLFIFTIVISLTLTYNELLKYEKKTPLYNENMEDDILKINRTLSVLIAIAFLVINIVDKDIKKKHNLDLKSADLQIDAGVLSLISTLIVLYVAFMGNGATSVENPED